MRNILTASWFAKLPPDATGVGISRGVPRRHAGYRRLRELEPGTWFNSVSPAEYLRRYRETLERLDAAEIRDHLFEFGEVPVLLCWETAADCHSGHKWCHRHIAAQWLEDRLGIEVREVGYPNLDRFGLLTRFRIDPPRFEPAGDPKIASDNAKYRK